MNIRLPIISSNIEANTNSIGGYLATASLQNNTLAPQAIRGIPQVIPQNENNIGFFSPIQTASEFLTSQIKPNNTISHNVRTNLILDNNLIDELKRVSYFELMKTPPSMHQLFSRDYMVLVKDLVNLQKDMQIDNSTTRVNSLNDSFSPLDQFSFKEIGNLNATVSLNSQSPNQVNQGNLEAPYNHLLYQNKEGQNNLHNQENKKLHENVRKNRFGDEQTEKEPYFDRKKQKKQKKFSQKLLKSLLSGLNDISRQLAKFIE